MIENFTKDTAYIRKHIDKLIPQPRRSKYLNRFAQYNLNRLVGRQAFLKWIHSNFNRHNLLVLQGVGGIGKTTIGKAYLKQYIDAYQHLAYIEVPDTSSLPITLMNQLATTDTGFEQNSSLTPDENFEKLLDCLQHIPSALLVIDNCNNDDELIRYRRPLESLHWKILVTSRCRIDSFQREGISREVLKLPESEALALFKWHYHSLSPKEAVTAKELLKKAHSHTMLIVLLAKAAYKNPLLRLEQIVEFVSRNDYQYQLLNQPVTMESEEGRVYDFILKLFKPETLKEREQKYLRYFSILPTQDLPITHLLRLFGISKEQEVEWLESLNDLVMKGWLESADNQFFKMHPLVQLVVRQKLIPTIQNCSIVINELGWLLKSVSYENPLHKRIYLPYVDSIDNFFSQEVDSDLATVYSSVAKTYLELGQPHQAQVYAKKAIAIDEKLQPADPTSLAISYCNLASAYQALGQYDQALVYDQKAIVIKEKLQPADLPSLAISYCNLANTYQALGQYKQALVYQLKDIAICEKVLPASHPDLASSYSNLATIYLGLDQPQEALLYGHKAVDILEKVLPADHPDLASSYSNLSNIYLELNQPQQALVYGHKAVDIREKVLPASHPDLASSYRNIAITYYHLEEYLSAKLYINRAISIWKDVSSETHSDLLQSINFLSFIEARLNKLDDNDTTGEKNII